MTSLMSVFGSYTAAKENAKLCEQHLEEAEHEAGERFKAVKRVMRELEMPVTVGNLRAIKRHARLAEHDEVLLALTGEPGYKIWRYIEVQCDPCFNCSSAKGTACYELLLPYVCSRLCKSCYKERRPDRSRFNFLTEALELVHDEFNPNARHDIYCWRTLGPNQPSTWLCGVCSSAQVKWHCRGTFDFLCVSCYGKKFFS